MVIGIDVRLWNQTGIGRYIRNLVENLSKIDHDNQYVLFARPEDYDDIKHLVHNSRFTLIKTNVRWHSLNEQIEFPRLLKKYNLDLVHFPYFSIPVFYNKPYVVTVHDLILNHFPTGKATTLPLPLYGLKRMGYSLIMSQAVKKAKKIMTPTIATKAEILDHYPVSSGKIVVTPEGVDNGLTHFKPALFKPQHPYFLYIGNAYPHKNVEKLIEAFLLFSQNHPEYKLLLAGKKDFFYKRLEQKTKTQNIEFLGYVEDIDLAKLYSQAKATFIPSLMEGFGLISLEAMQMRSLVAVSKIPSLEEVCRDHAFYFNPTDVLSIVQSMNEVVNLSDQDKKKRLDSAQKHAETFSWEKMAKLTLDVYNSCL